jgi:hypothetical protein
MSLSLIMWVLFALGAIFVSAAHVFPAPEPPRRGWDPGQSSRIGWVFWLIAAILLLVITVAGSVPVR